MNDIDKAYMAGILEGEGYIGIVRTISGTPRAQINIDSTDKELIDWIESLFGGRQYIRNTASEKIKETYRWRLEGYKAIELVTTLLPFMKIERKIRRAKILADEYRVKIHRNGRYTIEEKLQRDEMLERFRSSH